MPRCFEIGDQRGAGLIGVLALLGEDPWEIAVLIPAAVEELDEAHATFGEAAGKDAIGGDRCRVARIGAVEVEDVIGFIPQIGEFGDAGLHAKRHLVLRDTRFNVGIANVVKAVTIEICGGVKERATPFAGDAGRIVEIKDRFAGTTQQHALVATGKEAGAPEPGEQTLIGGDLGRN
jgi:hypothetical protein